MDICVIIDSKLENENREYMYFICVWFFICKRINFFFYFIKDLIYSNFFIYYERKFIWNIFIFIFLYVLSCRFVCKVDSDLKLVVVNMWFLFVVIIVSFDLCMFWLIFMVMILMFVWCNWLVMIVVVGGFVDWLLVNIINIFGILVFWVLCVVVKFLF